MALQDSIPYLLSRLEQNEATDLEVKSLMIMLEQRVDKGMMPFELFQQIKQYVQTLEAVNEGRDK